LWKQRTISQKKHLTKPGHRILISENFIDGYGSMARKPDGSFSLKINGSFYSKPSEKNSRELKFILDF